MTRETEWLYRLIEIVDDLTTTGWALVDPDLDTDRDGIGVFVDSADMDSLSDAVSNALDLEIPNIRGWMEAIKRADRERYAAITTQLLDALAGLYDHTKNNRNIAGLNQAAIEAIEAAVGRAPEGDAEVGAVQNRRE